MDVNNYSCVNYNPVGAVLMHTENDLFELFLEKKINYFSEIYFVLSGFSFYSDLDIYKEYNVENYDDAKKDFFNALKLFRRVKQ